MSESEEDLSEFDVRHTMARIPVQMSAQLSRSDYANRLTAILGLFDIASQVESGGVGFGDVGVEAEDQALLFALLSLVERRFGDFESDASQLR